MLSQSKDRRFGVCSSCAVGDRWPSELCGILPRSDVAEAANSGDLELECESVKSINTDDLWHV